MRLSAVGRIRAIYYRWDGRVCSSHMITKNSVSNKSVQECYGCKVVQGCSDAGKCDPQPSSCPPLTAEQRISQIPVCHGIKYSHLKKVRMKMMIMVPKR